LSEVILSYITYIDDRPLRIWLPLANNPDLLRADAAATAPRLLHDRHRLGDPC
jgi:hypothetical protein